MKCVILFNGIGRFSLIFCSGFPSCLIWFFFILALNCFSFSIVLLVILSCFALVSVKFCPAFHFITCFNFSIRLLVNLPCFALLSCQLFPTFHVVNCFTSVALLVFLSCCALVSSPFCLNYQVVKCVSFTLIPSQSSYRQFIQFYHIIVKCFCHVLLLFLLSFACSSQFISSCFIISIVMFVSLSCFTPFLASFVLIFMSWVVLVFQQNSSCIFSMLFSSCFPSVLP